MSLKGPAPSFQLQVKKIVVAVAVGSRAEFMAVLQRFHFIPHSLGAAYARLRLRAPRSPVQIVSTKGPKQGVVAATSARDGSRARRRRRLTKAARSASESFTKKHIVTLNARDVKVAPPLRNPQRTYQASGAVSHRAAEA